MTKNKNKNLNTDHQACHHFISTVMLSWGKRKSCFLTVTFSLSPQQLSPQIPTSSFLARHNCQRTACSIVVLLFNTIYNKNFFEMLE